jgi:hypothetical protein
MNNYYTGVKDCKGFNLYMGDTVILLNKGDHVKEECWYPHYEIVWDAPRYKLKHIGGGKDIDYAHWLFSMANCNKQLVLANVGPYRNKDDDLEVIRETELEQIIDERDNYHEWADKLAYTIADMLNTTIGEHSSINDPWQNALELLEEFISEKRLERRIQQNSKLLDAYRQAPECFQLQYLAGDDHWVNCGEVYIVHNDHKTYRLVTKESIYGDT